MKEVKILVNASKDVVLHAAVKKPRRRVQSEVRLLLVKDATKTVNEITFLSQCSRERGLSR